MSRTLSYAFARNNGLLVQEVDGDHLELLCCASTPPAALAEVVVGAEEVVAEPVARET